MKKILFTVASLLLIPLFTTAQNVGIGTTSPLEKLSVGSTSQFRVDINGNITRINNLPYSFPNTQGSANYFLRNDGLGNLTWAAISSPRPVVKIFNVTPDGFSAWAIDNPSDYQSASNLNPGLVLYRGFTYEFNINASGHPFRIATGQGGPAYNTGVTNNGTMVGVITFTVPMDAPSTLHYYCTVHLVMNGPITIR